MKFSVAVLAAVAIILGSAGATVADPTVAAIAPPAKDSADPALARKQALARRYFAAMHYRETMDTMMSNVLPVILDAQVKRYPELPDRYRAALTASAREAMDAIMPEVIDDGVAAVANVFTEKELEKLVEFYESDVGQSVMAKNSALTVAMTGSMKTLLPRMQSEMMNRLCRKVDCAALPKPVETRPS